ncbi:MAG: hypothetical protein QOF35_21 [Actinomycetota bacterium]|nr:hypothetical protein [Actinomycetota bacterium]
MTQQPDKAGRRPNFSAFLLTGGAVGLLVGIFLGLVGPAAPRYDASAGMGLLGVIFAGIGVLVGGVIAVLIDKRR